LLFDINRICFILYKKILFFSIVYVFFLTSANSNNNDQISEQKQIKDKIIFKKKLIKKYKISGDIDKEIKEYKNIYFLLKQMSNSSRELNNNFFKLIRNNVYRKFEYQNSLELFSFLSKQAPRFSKARYYKILSLLRLKQWKNAYHETIQFEKSKDILVCNAYYKIIALCINSVYPEKKEIGMSALKKGLYFFKITSYYKQNQSVMIMYEVMLFLTSNKEINNYFPESELLCG